MEQRPSTEPEMTLEMTLTRYAIHGEANKRVIGVVIGEPGEVCSVGFHFIDFVIGHSVRLGIPGGHKQHLIADHHRTPIVAAVR